MPACLFPVLLLALALGPGSLGCGTSKQGASRDASATTDGRSDDALLCGGKPAVGCVVGAPSDAGGVWCQGFVMPAGCRDGQWSCPSGMVFDSDCTCGEPGLSCANPICTANGPVCLDAGVGADPDATLDVPVDGEQCGDAPNPYCAQVVGTGDVVVCGDSFSAATCVGGAWTCAPGQIESRSCTCTEFHPPGCGICTPHGWACSDAGVDGDAAS